MLRQATSGMVAAGKATYALPSSPQEVLVLEQQHRGDAEEDEMRGQDEHAPPPETVLVPADESDAK